MGKDFESQMTHIIYKWLSSQVIFLSFLQVACTFAWLSPLGCQQLFKPDTWFLRLRTCRLVPRRPPCLGDHRDRGRVGDTMGMCASPGPQHGRVAPQGDARAHPFQVSSATVWSLFTTPSPRSLPRPHTSPQESPQTGLPLAPPGCSEEGLPRFTFHLRDRGVRALFIFISCGSLFVFSSILMKTGKVVFPLGVCWIIFGGSTVVPSPLFIVADIDEWCSDLLMSWEYFIRSASTDNRTYPFFSLGAPTGTWLPRSCRKGLRTTAVLTGSPWVVCFSNFWEGEWNASS